MNIYISGITGTGMGPLALMTKDAGFHVAGSDLHSGMIAQELTEHKIEYEIGTQNGDFLQAQHDQSPIDWFIYTSALPESHPELVLARNLGIKTSKRDDFINYLIQELGLKLIAVSGTHGKTTTTAMIIWLFKKLQIPVSYLVGTTLSFASSGAYDSKSRYFIYEADEYDRNFLSFHPDLAVIPAVSYDHPDIYPSVEDYKMAFQQFERQSSQVIKNLETNPNISLSGQARRADATLAIQTLITLNLYSNESELVDTVNQFPGVGRRFERISNGFYSDYAHHPEEIIATLQIAKEEASRLGKSGVIAVYEPHQNSRQVEIFNEYRDAFIDADYLYWLPTFLTRENPNLEVITPHSFINSLTNKDRAETAILDNNLIQSLIDWRNQNYLIILMTAGPADAWFRKNFSN